MRPNTKIEDTTADVQCRWSRTQACHTTIPTFYGVMTETPQLWRNIRSRRGRNHKCPQGVNKARSRSGAKKVKSVGCITLHVRIKNKAQDHTRHLCRRVASAKQNHRLEHNFIRTKTYVARSMSTNAFDINFELKKRASKSKK